jgi:hypothetical protein
MDLPALLAWLVDESGASPGPDRFLAELGGRLLDGLPLAGLGPVQEDTVGPAPDGSGAGLGRDPAVRPRRGRSVAIGPALRRGAP